MLVAGPPTEKGIQPEKHGKSYFFHFFYCIPPHTFDRLRFYIDYLAQRLSKDLLRSYEVTTIQTTKRNNR
jgi:hypothetical protein